MYNLADYILLSRSAYILTTTNTQTLHEVNSSDMSFEQACSIDNGIRNFFTYLYPGVDIKKFVVCTKMDIDVKYIPIYLITIENYKEGKKLIVPMFLSFTSLNMIITLYDPDHDISNVQTTVDFLDSNILSIFSNPINISEFTQSEEYKFFREILETKLDIYYEKVGSVIERLYMAYQNISQYNLTDMRLDGESRESKYIINKYMLDKKYNGDNESMNTPIIDQDLFFPLVVQESSDSSDGKINYYLTAVRTPNYSMTKIKAQEVSEIENLDDLNSNTSIYIKVPDNVKVVIVDSTCMVYIGNGKLVASVIKKVLDSDTDKQDVSKYYTLDLRRITIFDDENENSFPEELYETHEDFQAVMATESIISNMKSMYGKLKDAGMNVKVDLLPHLRKILGMPKDVIVWTYKQVTRLFNVINQLEQNKALDYQEKILNDELSTFIEKYQKGVGNAVVAGISLMIPTTFIFQILIFLIMKKAHENLRLKAIERVEHSLEDKIQRINKKIEFATQDYNKEAVNELKKEKANYMFAVERLLEVKKEVYGKGRKESAFKLEEQND